LVLARFVGFSDFFKFAVKPVGVTALICSIPFLQLRLDQSFDFIRDLGFDETIYVFLLVQSIFLVFKVSRGLRGLIQIPLLYVANGLPIFLTAFLVDSMGSKMREYASGEMMVYDYSTAGVLVFCLPFIAWIVVTVRGK